MSKQARQERRERRDTTPAYGALVRERGLPAWTPWALAAVTFFVFARGANNAFINFDDDAYITNNPHVLGGLTVENVKWALTNISYFCWQPLTWLSHQADVAAFGLNPGPHHLINVVIHSANAALCFLLVRRIVNNEWAALVAAAMWALHPLRVESVSWAAERKDVLSVFFYLLATLSYVKRAPWWQTTLWFVLGMAAKPTLVSFPIVVTLLDVWPLKRWDLREKIPWFVLAIVLSFVTVQGAGQMGATAALGDLSLNTRVVHALWSYLQYIVQTVWPVGLSVIYPYSESLETWKPLVALTFLIAITIAVWKVRDRYPAATLGWAWYVITLAPMSGIIQAGPQAGADRYSYLPSIGLMLIVISFAPRIRYAGLVVAAVLAGLTTVQIGFWKNSVTLFEHAIAVTTDNWIAMRNLGGGLVAEGRSADGIKQFRASLARAPRQPETNYQLGSAIAGGENWIEALPYFEEAIKLAPDYGSAEYARGTALAHLARNDEAKRSLERALTLQLAAQFQAEAHNTLGVIAITNGDRAAAEQHFLTAIQLNPSLGVAQQNLAALRAQIKR